MTKQKGSILIFTLWVLVILATFSIVLSHRASTDVNLAKYESDKIKATYLARAGIVKMLAELTKDTNAYDSLNEDWNRDKDDPKVLTLRNDKVFYGASDESSRLNLNSGGLKKETFVRLGLDEPVAEKLLDYKTEKAEEAIEFIEELFLVEGMDKDIYSEIKDLVTIYRDNDPKVNINTSSEEVLYAILGEEGLVQDIVDYRKGYDGEEGTEDDGIFKDTADISMIEGVNPALFTTRSQVFRIWAESHFSEDEGMFKGVESVVSRAGKIYHWKEY